jgi:hypothetical protein
MSGGVAHKFQGTSIAITTAFATASPAVTITAITRANPPVVSATGHGLVEGNVVEFNDVVGMTELNGRRFVVGDVTANTFELADVDATAYGAYTSGGTVLEAAFSNFCELTGYNRQGGASAEIDVTTICSTGQEFLLGLPDFGTTQIDYNFAPEVGVQQAIEAAYRSGELIAVRVTLPNGGGERIQMGYVQQTSETASVGGVWTASMTIRNTGAPVDVAAA